MTLTKKLKTRWIKALRSGKYKQTTGSLKDCTGFCCLGVLCDLVDKTNWREGQYGEFSYGTSKTGYMPYRMGILGRATQKQLAEMNDDQDSFEEIADYIKENVQAVD